MSTVIIHTPPERKDSELSIDVLSIKIGPRIEKESNTRYWPSLSMHDQDVLPFKFKGEDILNVCRQNRALLCVWNCSIRIAVDDQDIKWKLRIPSFRWCMSHYCTHSALCLKSPLSKTYIFSFGCLSNQHLWMRTIAYLNPWKISFWV